MVFVPACPGSREESAREQVPLVVAGPVGEDEILHSIDAATEQARVVHGGERKRTADFRRSWLSTRLKAVSLAVVQSCRDPLLGDLILAVEAFGVDAQKHLDAMASPLGHLGGGYSPIEPGR
jgi:hypothetical protein